MNKMAFSFHQSVLLSVAVAVTRCTTRWRLWSLRRRRETGAEVLVFEKVEFPEPSCGSEAEVAEGEVSPDVLAIVFCEEVPLPT